MSEKDNGGPAFPVQDMSKWQVPGMTLRDYFAAKALIAYHSDGNFSSHEDTANWCYSMAEAMLEARND